MYTCVRLIREAQPVLAQIPLIISPFIQPPKAVTLPFNFNKLPPSIPPPPSNCTVEDVENISKSAKQVQEFIERTRTELQDEYKQWRVEVERREVEEKRRIAPGYLDSGNRMLQPAVVRKAEPLEQINSTDSTSGNGSSTHTQVNDIDKVFGTVHIS